MPIEIKELVVRNVVGDAASQAESSSGSSPNEEALVERCVQQILKILEKRKEP